MDRIEYEVIKDCVRCREIVHRLHRQPIVAVGGEGIRLGKDGPLMLLQIGTASGTVFIFDIFQNRDMMDKGGLGLFLRSSATQKVMNGCVALSAALHFQFAVNTHNVFDTQVAHAVIERHKGRQLPPNMSLSELCHMYSNNVNKYDSAFDEKDVWEKMIPNFWSQRPLTPNMIELAINDLIAIFPEVYNTQREHIQTSGLENTFKDAVSTELLLDIDSVINTLTATAVRRRAHDVIYDFNEFLADTDIKLEEIDNEDVIQALFEISFDTAEKVSPKINKLKEECILRELLQIECSICSSRDRFEPEALLIERLMGYTNHFNEEIRERARITLDHVRCTVLGNVVSKYFVSTPAYCLAPVEKIIISAPFFKDSETLRSDPVIQHFRETLTHNRVEQFH